MPLGALHLVHVLDGYRAGVHFRRATVRGAAPHDAESVAAALRRWREKNPSERSK